MMSGVRGCTVRGLVVWHGASACLNQLNSLFPFHLLLLCPLPGSDTRPGAYICPAFKSPLPQLLLPTSATQGGIPLPLFTCCLYPCSRLCGISPQMMTISDQSVPMFHDD